MKKIIVTLAAIVALTACADKKTIDGVTYRPYGLINEGSCKNDSIYYEVSGWAATSGVIFSEFFFIPTIYTFGYNLWEPVCKKSEINKNPKAGVIR